MVELGGINTKTMVTSAPWATSPNDLKQKAQNFIESVKSGNKPHLVEPLTPEIEEAVKAELWPIDDANRRKILEALAELKKDTLLSRESGEGSLSSLFEWAKSDLMKNAPKLVDALIDPELDTWNPKLTPLQKENVKLALIDRIVSGAASQALFSGLRGKLDKIGEKFSTLTKWLGSWSITDQADALGKKADDISKIFDLSSDEPKGSDDGGMEGKIRKQVEEILAWSLKMLKEVYVNEPLHRDALFGNPKALADYKPGDAIPALLDRSGNASLMRAGYKETIKAKILALESSILSAESKKNTVMDFLAKTPEFIRDRVFGLLEWLSKIPFLSDILAAFFGYSSGKSLIENLKLESKERRTILELREFGMRKNDKGTVEKWSEHGKIKLIENIDWSDTDFSKMKPFFITLRKAGVKLPIENFWKIVFEWGKMEYEVDGKKQTLLFPAWDTRFDTTAEKIVEKLNTATRLQAAETPAPAQVAPPTPPAAPAQAPRPEGQVTPPPKGAEAVKTGGRPTAPEAVAAWAAAATITPPRPTTSPQTPMETPENARLKSLTEAFAKANSFPIPFGNGEQVAFSNEILSIWSQSYKILWVSGTRKVAIKDMKFATTWKIPDAVELVHSFSFLKKTYQDRGDIAQNLPTLLALSPQATVEIPNAQDREKMIALYTKKWDSATEEEREFMKEPSYLIVTRTA